MTIGQYSHAELPRLSTSRVLCRRDSLSSSKTRDSGYNSDLEALSPLDLPGFGQDRFCETNPPIPHVVINYLSSTIKRSINVEGSKQMHSASITSNPASLCTTICQRRPAFLSNLFESESMQACLPQPESDGNVTVHDQGIEKWVRENLPSRDRPKERVSSIASLSSTSSCEIYTSTDISDDEQEHSSIPMQLFRPRATAKIIHLILRKVEAKLCQAAYRHCTNRTTSVQRVAPGLVSQQSSHKASQSSEHKRKYHPEGSLPPDDDDDDDQPHKRRGISARIMSNCSEMGVKFACPFYKHAPDQYRNRRTCPGPGWPTVHRMKEHLYRSHAQPIFCPICYSTFKSDKEQLNHVRLQQCQRSAPQQMDGIDRETVWTLRKRTTAFRLEEDKWRDVYHVLFPDVVDGDIPSPFYDCDSPSESSRRFRRNLLRRVQAELFAEAEQMPGPVEQRLLQRVAQIIRNCEEDLLRVDTFAADVQIPERRGSIGSTLSMLSTTSSSGHATPAHTQPVHCPPPLFTHQLPTLGYRPNPDNFTVNQPTDVSCSPAEQCTQPPVVFTPVTWDDSTYDTFGLGIDWDDIFTPGLEALHTGTMEPFAGIPTPVYT